MKPDDHTDEPLVLFEKRGHVGLILLNDKHRHNALCAGIATGVLAALEQSRREHARAIVISSTQKAFCAGADIKEMLHSGWLTGASTTTDMPTPLDLFEALEADGRPIIAAVNGLALGGGVELALSCDLILASGDAAFALPEVGLGVIPNTAIARLPALIGNQAALELIWTRRKLTADQAKALGIVSQVVQSVTLIDHAIALAQSIVADAPPGAVAAVKRGVRKGGDWAEIRALLGAMDNNEWNDGFSAFLDKRKPDYDAYWDKK